MDFIRKILIFAFAIGFLILWIPDIMERRIAQGFAQPDAPSSPERVLSANRSLMLMFDYKTAAENYEKAYKLACTNKNWIARVNETERGKIVFRIALCHEKNGREAEARKWYTYYLKYYPNHIWHDQGDERFKKLDAM